MWLLDTACGPPTLGTYSQRVERITNTIGQLPARSLKPERIARWQSDLLKSGLASGTVADVRVTLHQVLEIHPRCTVRVVSHSPHVDMPAAVYDASAEGYIRFVGVEISAATEGPVDRSLLGAFVELMADAPAGRVADLGCGPGRVAAFLAAHEFDVFGVDVSAAMVVAARNAHPTIEFEQGQLTALPIADASLACAVCWYSIIYTPPEHLDDVCLELSRVMAPGGYLLVAFQAGQGEGLHQANAHGTNLPLTSYRHDPDVVIRTLSGTGLKVHLRALREPQFTHESSPQAFIIARAEPPQP